jgi:hypothetical protein
MCDPGIHPKKNVWFNESIYPLNKTFLLGKKPKIHFLRKRQTQISFETNNEDEGVTVSLPEDRMSDPACASNIPIAGTSS